MSVPSATPSEKGAPEVTHIEHFIDIIDLYERAAGRTLDNQTFSRKVDDIPEGSALDEDDVHLPFPFLLSLFSVLFF